MSLGSWQTSRFLEKKERETVRDARLQKPPAEIESLEELLAEDHAYRKATLRGRLDTSTNILIKHRHYEGNPGSWLLQPLRFAEGDGVILVNRGWLPFQKANEAIDEYATADAEAYTGLIHRLPKVVADEDNRKAVAAGKLTVAGQTTRWDTIDVTTLYDALSAPAPDEPLLLVLDEKHSGAPYPRASYDHVTEPYLTSGRHLSYAAFWFAVALALAGLYLAAGFGALGSHKRGTASFPDKTESPNTEG